MRIHFTQNERVELRKRYRRRKTHGTLRKPQLANLPSRRGLYTDLWGNSEMTAVRAGRGKGVRRLRGGPEVVSGGLILKVSAGVYSL